MLIRAIELEPVSVAANHHHYHHHDDEFGSSCLQHLSQVRSYGFEFQMNTSLELQKKFVVMQSKEETRVRVRELNQSLQDSLFSFLFRERAKTIPTNIFIRNSTGSQAKQEEWDWMCMTERGEWQSNSQDNISTMQILFLFCLFSLLTLLRRFGLKTHFISCRMFFFSRSRERKNRENNFESFEITQFLIARPVKTKGR